ISSLKKEAIDAPDQEEVTLQSLMKMANRISNAPIVSNKPIMYIRQINATSANFGEVQDHQSGDRIMTKNASSPAKQSELRPRSAWANGLFYLTVFVVVILGLGILANSVPFWTLVVVLITAVIVIPIIGAFQLRQDDRLTEKSFLELMRLVIKQLP